MIKIPFLTVIIFFILTCVYHIHSGQAQYQGPSHRPVAAQPTQHVVLDPPYVHHKKRFSLFYRAKQQKSSL